MPTALCARYGTQRLNPCQRGTSPGDCDRRERIPRDELDPGPQLRVYVPDVDKHETWAAQASGAAGEFNDNVCLTPTAPRT